ncbi:ATP-dependent helicase [Psychrobium sp. 1_MG-2023]|uniref:ATP-dependent helicase n=1 Tax=Psychrobium sp. 1_MG-2023 TaxID=3062624 RepID=UPI0027368564|nr:ATP-dependent helicase [Psychrobium sp. 1_MG-2023]MDP2560760.1 ATP-dependent helicase [Psychrobium sp. 1_MG-2023]
MTHKKLTHEQLRVVNHSSGHALVQAVPGSGKTTTMIKRVQRLINNGVNPANILVLMYNKAAQISFTEKLKVTLKSSMGVTNVKTFHALAKQVIEQAQDNKLLPYKKLLIPTAPQYQSIIREAYNIGHDTRDEYVDNKEIEDFESQISKFRSDAITPEELDNDPLFEEILQANKVGYKRYIDLLEELELRTFDDLLIDASVFFRKYPLNIPQYSHIIVDEYQDANYIQHRLLVALAKNNAQVMAVGDVNQCIYEWRGSKPDFISGIFSRDFNNPVRYQLSCTFRFGHKVSLMANVLIAKNKNKAEGLCISHPSNINTSIDVISCDETITLVRQSIQAVNSAQGSTAFIARSKAQLVEIELALKLLKQPYISSSKNSILSRYEVNLLVMCFILVIYKGISFISNHEKISSLLSSFLNNSGLRWKKGESKKIRQKIIRAPEDFWLILNKQLPTSSQNPNKQAELLSSLKQLEGGDIAASSLLKSLIKLGIIEAIDEGSPVRQVLNDRARGVDKIAELLSSVDISATEFVNLILSEPISAPLGEPVIELATIHASKGLEWDNVIVTGLIDKEFPGGASARPQEIKTAGALEEERRLFYVAITRAKQKLTLHTPTDDLLERWLNNRRSSSPNRSVIASKFVFESGVSSAISIGEKIHQGLSITNIRNRSQLLNRYTSLLRRL